MQRDIMGRNPAIFESILKWRRRAIFKRNSSWLTPKPANSGNIMFALFAAVGMIGILGASAATVIKGPVTTMHNVTQRTIAENNMIASAKLALMWASSQDDGGDCDGDGATEPPPWVETTGVLKPVGGGNLPAYIGASLQDPWGNTYGYCSWDHGPQRIKTTPTPTCLTPTQRREGTNNGEGIVIAIISSGPDKIFQTSCADAPDYVNKVSGSDDVIFTYTFGEAQVQSAGLWKLKEGESSTAEIGPRDIEIKGSVGGETVRIGYDAGLGMSGVGDFMAVKTDYLHSKNGATSPITMESGLRLKNVPGLAAPLSSDIAHTVGTLVEGKWCSFVSGKINCNIDAPLSSESDPKVGALNNGKWCSSNGSVITCTNDAPTAGVIAPPTCTGDNNALQWTGSAWNCIAIAGSGGGGAPTMDLVNIQHSSAQCTAIGGTVITDGANKFCRFNGASCPSGWTAYLNWSTYTAKTCNGGCYGGCTAAARAWGNAGAPACTYYNSDYNSNDNCTYTSGALTCSANRSQIGCY
jgi:hypothetical protein